MTYPIGQFYNAIRNAGLNLPNSIIDDGRIHRFSSNGNPKDDAGWYVLHPNNGGAFYAGAFGCHRLGLKENWHQNIGREYTREEKIELSNKVAEARRLYEEEEATRRKEAKVKAAKIWDKSIEASLTHEYLTRKKIKPQGVKEYKGMLVVPAKIGDEIQTLQFIKPDGEKRFLRGGSTTGSHHHIGGPITDKLLICEGFATGVTLYQATGFPVAITFYADNLIAVTQYFRGLYPDIDIILCADDDWKTKGNPGLTKATEAAISVNGKVAVPKFFSDRPEKATDFNDLYGLSNATAVNICVEKAESPIKNDSNGVILTRGSDIEIQPIEWLWDNWLAKGMFHILAGAPGTGKTTIAIALASIITEGGRWPLGVGRLPQAQNVMIWSGEDDIHRTLTPRLAAHGAVLENIYFISGYKGAGEKSRSFDPATDVPLLLSAAKKIGNVGLIIVDPVSSVIEGDAHQNSEVRRGLQPLVDLGLELNAAILGITHFTKGTIGRDPLERVIGSVAFGAMPRIALVTAKAEVNGIKRRVLAKAKSNIGSDEGGFYYDINYHELPGHEGVVVAKIAWIEKAEGSARELLAEANNQDRSDSSLEEAENFVTVTLKGGPLLSTELAELAKKANISERTLQRARQKLGIKPYRDGNEKGSPWKCKLPGKFIQQLEDRQDHQHFVGAEYGEHY